MEYSDKNGNKIKLGREIARGGEGAVYEILNDHSSVAKLYTRKISLEKTKKLEEMVSFYTPELAEYSAWPTKILYSNSKSVGFIMKKISGFKEVHMLYGNKSRQKEFNKADWSFILRAARNLASAVAMVHSSNIVIGDVNQGNMLVSSNALVNLIDCDSYQVSVRNKDFLCEVGVGHYTPPELQGRSFEGIKRTHNHDNFGLGILLFQLLFLGRHPFSGKGAPAEIEKAIQSFKFCYSKNALTKGLSPPPTTLPFSSLHPKVSELFERAFSESASKNAIRPLAQEWVEALEIQEKSLRTCSSNPIHKFYKGISQCPWCTIENNSGTVLFDVGIAILDSSTNPQIIWTRIKAVKSPGEAPNITISGNIILPTPLPDYIKQGRFKNNLTKWFQTLGCAAIGLFIIIALFANNAGFFGFIGIFFLWSIISGILQQEADTCKEEKNKRTQSLKDAEANWNKTKSYWDKESGDTYFNSKFNELENVYRELLGLDNAFLREKQALERNIKEYQLNKFLDRFNIAGAKLNGIGDGLKAQLASFGIETAADITRKIYGIPGFGEVRINTLMDWRRSVEAKFHFNPNQGIDTKDLQQLKNKYTQKKQTLINSLLRGEKELIRIKSSILTKRTQLLPQMQNLLNDLQQKRADMKIF